MFGDQTVAATPATSRASLLHLSRSGSPVPSLDINPPEVTKPRSPPLAPQQQQQQQGGVASLFRGIFGRKSEPIYRRLDEGDDV